MAFGEDLKRERESRGISLDQIVEMTKISPRHLTAIEENHFEQLPGGVFNKGIVRSYTRVLELDEEAWVEKFMAAYAGSGAVTGDDASWIAFAENVSRTRPQTRDTATLRLRWTGVMMLLLMLAGIAYAVMNYVETRVRLEGASGVSTQHSEKQSTYSEPGETRLGR